jgi:hypothetical protein
MPKMTVMQQTHALRKVGQGSAEALASGADAGAIASARADASREEVSSATNKKTSVMLQILYEGSIPKNYNHYIV